MSKLGEKIDKRLTDPDIGIFDNGLGILIDKIGRAHV